MIKKYAVIVAGGNGTRMGTDTPKQFLKIACKPVLMHTIEAFVRVDPSISIIIVLPESQKHTWELLCHENNFDISHKIVYGGKTRFHSVKNGLATIPDPYALVAIHDGVRPFVNENTIINSFNSAETNGSGIASIKLKDSLRQLSNGNNRQVNRNEYVAIQTPQTFQNNLLMRAFEQEYSEKFTDDASVVEAMGQEIHLVDGSYENIKITTKEDLIFAEALLAHQNR